MTDAKTRIDETVKANDVVLYMKGTKEMPNAASPPVWRAF